MNHDHTPDEELQSAMHSALRDEPPMTGLPHDDLVRGRSRLRRRRAGTAVGVAAVVPATALMATVVPYGPSDGPSGPGFADSPSSDPGSIEAECVGILEGSGSTRPLAKLPGGSDFPQALESRAKLREARPSQADAPRVSVNTGGRLKAVKPGALEDDGLGTLTGDQESTCEALPGEPMEMPELDRLEQALTDTLDPLGEHMTSFLAGAAASAQAPGSDPEQEKVSQASVTGDWAEGDRLGNVSLDVADATAAGSTMGDPAAAPCEDPGVMPGPSLTCEQRELADGTVVLVGTGSKNGFERITVRYDRVDGQIVWGTADEATGMWWEDGSGAAPLDAPPVTVNQLIELVQEPRVHL